MAEMNKTIRRPAKLLRYRMLAFLAVLGPGFITANVDNDPGGILTYSLQQFIWLTHVPGISISPRDCQMCFLSFCTRFILPPLLCCVVCAAQVAPRTWQVRFGAADDMLLTVTNNGGSIEFRNDKAVVFTIPAAAITAVFHTRQQVRRSTRAFNFFEGICCGGTDSHLLSALAYVVASPLGSSTTEYVEIDWKTSGPGVVQLRLNRDDYTPFMDWVSGLSGVHWRDLELEAKETADKIEQKAEEAFSVHDTTRDGQSTEYEALPIDSDDGQTLLYLFRGRVEPKRLVGIFPVIQEFSNNDCVSSKEGRIVRGACRNGACEIRAILKRDSTYRPGSLPHTFTTDVDGLSPSECRTLDVGPVQRDGDRKTLRRANAPEKSTEPHP